MTNSERGIGEHPGPRITRRTLARGAAWSAPVVLLGVPVPAFAASPTGCCVTSTWTRAEYSGNKGAWSFFFSLSNCGTLTSYLRQVDVYTYYNGGAVVTHAMILAGNALATIPVGTPVTYSTGKMSFAGFLSDAARQCYYVPAVNELQTVTVGTGVTSFRLTFTGQTTASITTPASAATVQAALEALSNIGAGNVAVTGNTGGPYTVEFKGVYASTDVAQMTATATGGTVTVVTNRNGGLCGDAICYAPDNSWWTTTSPATWPPQRPHPPCEILLRDRTYVVLTFSDAKTGTGSCTRRYTLSFSPSQACGTTAGCAAS